MQIKHNNKQLIFQRVQDAEAVLPDGQLVTEMTPQQLEYLDLLAASRDIMLDDFQEKFEELKQDIGQVKVNKIFLNFRLS